jgi:hypothetical protein
MLTVFNAEAGRLDAASSPPPRADCRDPALVHLAVAPQWDALRADPRFTPCCAHGSGVLKRSPGTLNPEPLNPERRLAG